MTRGRKKIVREEHSPEEYPILKPIFGGRWSAHGDGWAVDGDTQEEALENYRQAEQRHQEILSRPSKKEEGMSKQIWIPSKTRLREQLAKELSASLQAHPIKELAFRLWVNDNAGVLAWIGEEQQRQLIQDIVEACGLEVTENLDYEG